MKTRFLSKGGFTLIELLLVIGIIAILASIVIVAINPTKQLGDARNAQRRSDVNTILNAVYQYAIDHNGTLPGNITTTATEICRSTETADCASLVRLHALTGSYLVSIPVDPQETDANTAGYTIAKDVNGRVTVASPGAELGATISVTR
ncbi:MAG: prepilin-type N-terminal cleavage/methylation domain-containing protein [Candidatus Peribacteraceae bacterium]|nr:prepilin-type N-terminal cleavage/methylation domain-containing protein [Candidatus Peribacteraceae bacterium]